MKEGKQFGLTLVRDGFFTRTRILCDHFDKGKSKVKVNFSGGSIQLFDKERRRFGGTEEG